VGVSEGVTVGVTVPEDVKPICVLFGGDIVGDTEGVCVGVDEGEPQLPQPHKAPCTAVLGRGAAETQSAAIDDRRGAGGDGRSDTPPHTHTHTTTTCLACSRSTPRGRALQRVPRLGPQFPSHADRRLRGRAGLRGGGLMDAEAGTELEAACVAEGLGGTST